MSQNLKPPAYQTYAANILSNRNFKRLNLAARGLLHTMQMECWVNHNIPCDPSEIAMIFGLQKDDIEASLPAVMSFFAVVDGVIICPEIEDYRKYRENIRLQQKAGGKKGATIREDNKIKEKRNELMGLS